MSPGEFLTSLIAILIIMAIISAVEILVPLFPPTPSHSERKFANLGLTVIGFFINWALTSAAAVLALAGGQGIMARAGLSFTAQLILSVVVLDFFYGYLAHVGLHFVPLLWRAHAVHHSDPFVDVTTTYRAHPIEVGWRGLFLIVPTWILGVPPIALVVYRLLSALNGLFEHANLRVWPAVDRALSLVWVTPNMHKIHHSRERIETNSNYGNLLSIHDRLFRTFTDTRRALSVRYGLDDTNPSAIQSMPELLTMRVRSTPETRRQVPMLAVFIALGAAIAFSLAWVQGNRGTDATPKGQKQPTVLFICPHGAAKSVLASAYFQRLAKERGLNVRVDAAGIEPQEAVSTVVKEHLERNGYSVPVTKPRAVTKEELSQADVVISLGCDVSRLPVTPRAIRKWDEVPGPSEDFNGADEAIRNRVIALVEELLARQKR